MKTASLVLGILAIVGMIIGFIPCFGSLNWLNIPFSVIGLVIGIVALAQSKGDEPKGNAIAGTVLCGAAILFGLIRLMLGGGVI
ncbi:MAG TPA: hypothetical protein VHO72_01390 [Bacteroidales bacterium]|nr:hypothetical protein [Bacteroidales bacterium]